MKILKNAQQKNFRVDKEMYTEYQLTKLLAQSKIHRHPMYYYYKEEGDFKHAELYEWHLVVFTNDCKEVKVIYDKEIGLYRTIAILNDNTEISIEL